MEKSEEKIINQLTSEFNLRPEQVTNTVKLIDDGNTIPFIARYRKEAHGAMDDTTLRALETRLQYLKNLQARRDEVKSSIESQGKLTDDLKNKILAAETLVVVEDLYRPYRPKRKTRASVAKEKGLDGLADLIREQKFSGSLEEAAAAYVNPEKGAADTKEALQGAQDILAEGISDEADYRMYIRKITMDEGKLTSTARDEKAQSVYEMYYQYEEPLKKAAGHRVLALNRGEAEKFLTVKVEAPRDRILQYLAKKVITEENPVTEAVLRAVIEDSYDRLIAPAIERDIRNELTEKAEEGAISVFGKNLEQLLMQPPIAGHVVLGWDPAFRTGCKLAVVDATGKVLDTKVIYPTAPQNKVEEAKKELKKLIDKYDISLISVGNGTASRESEQVIVDLIKELKKPVQYVIVNEAGASVYSASKLATEEFPQFDVGQRSAASIARRLQDPLSELVKIDPKSIGVGQYQHDMNQKKLGEALGGVVEDCVNRVGVDLNTASAPLLEYISGISKTVAKNIVEYREANGRFTNRKQLLKVPKLGPKAFEQCAGFLRIADGENPLDATSVHPESYPATMELLKKLELSMEDVRMLQAEAKKGRAAQNTSGADSKNTSGDAARQNVSAKNKANRKDRRQNGFNIRNTDTAMGRALAAAMQGMTLDADNGGTDKKGANASGRSGAGASNAANASTGAAAGSSTSGSQKTAAVSALERRIPDKKKLAEELGIGEITLTDIVRELEKPARDPREDMPRPILRSDVLDMKDLKPGMVLKGTVRNVIDFGVFVDIGVHQDGLVHISQITDRFIKHPLEAVSVGDIVDVKVLDVDPVKKRIGLTMRLDQK